MNDSDAGISFLDFAARVMRKARELPLEQDSGRLADQLTRCVSSAAVSFDVAIDSVEISEAMRQMQLVMSELRETKMLLEVMGELSDKITRQEFRGLTRECEALQASVTRQLGAMTIPWVVTPGKVCSVRESRGVGKEPLPSP